MVRRNSSGMSDDMSEMSPTGSEAPFNDRKKQTHLRCERQRREAINVSEISILAKKEKHRMATAI